MAGSRSHLRIVLRDRFVRLSISRMESFSRKYIRRILANMPTVITLVGGVTAPILYNYR